MRTSMQALVRVATTAAVFSVAACAAPEAEVDPEAEGFDESTEEVRASSESFYTVLRDTRRCAAPACGGYWLARAGYRTTRCADGRSAATCYVASLTTPGFTDDDRERVLGGAAATGVTMVILGSLQGPTAVVSRAYTAPTGGSALTGTLRLLSRPACAPNARCASLVTRPLSRDASTVLTQASFASAPGTEAELARARDEITRPVGVVATGRLVNAAGGRGFEVAQYLLPVTPPAGFDPNAPQCGSALESTLASASEGLLMPSESDYPFTVVNHVGAGAEALTVARFRAIFSVPASTPVEVRSIADQFRWVSTDRPDMTAEERATAARFRALTQTLLRNMPDAKVFRVGRVEIHTYVVGRTSCGDVAGVQTILIET